MKLNSEAGGNRSLEQTRIAREVFAAAESMGIADRSLVELSAILSIPCHYV